MEIWQNRGEASHFIANWKTSHEDYLFLDFDVFIVRELGYSFQTKEELDKFRRRAFLDFRKKTGHFMFASLPTMRKWFGIGSFSRPRREQVLAICLKMQTGRKKASEYLMIGLGESAFQIRDYREVIFMYGLENGMTFEFCLDLINKFEKKVDFRSKEENTISDEVFEQEFMKIIDKSPDVFLSWMLSEQKFFKGYQDVISNILQYCRKEVLLYIRKDARKKLEDLLAETNFRKWLSKKKYHEVEPRELFRRFVRSRHNAEYKGISKNMGDNILELSSIAFSQLEANSKLLAEVFPFAGNTVFNNIKGMSAKHLSDLFNVSLQWERLLVSNQTCCKLMNLDGESNCPDWLNDIAEICNRPFHELQSVKDALYQLTIYSEEQRRRCIDIRRGDILPMIHYVSQCQYLDSIDNTEEKYNMKNAKSFFATKANHMLRLCQMAPLNKEYELDSVLLSCFQPDEMYSYSEILELAKK